MRWVRSFVPPIWPAPTRKPRLTGLRTLVAEGVLPQKSLQDAQAKLADIEDDEVLARTLYGGSQVQDLSSSDADAMVRPLTDASDRQSEIAASRLKLVESGVVARAEAQPAEDELDMRRHTLELARNRARLLHELTVMAEAERTWSRLGPMN